MRDRASSSEVDGDGEGVRGWIASEEKEESDVWGAMAGFSGLSELARRWSGDIGGMTVEEEEKVSALERGFVGMISVVSHGSEERD